MKSKLKDIIDRVPNWDTITPGELFAALNAKTVLYVDTKQYRLVDVARVIHADNMENFLAAVEAAKLQWMIMETAVGFTPGAEDINTKLKAIDNPYARQLAEHTRRFKSLLETYNLETTPQEVEQVQEELKLDQVRQQEIDSDLDKHYAYVEAIMKWDGKPETKPIRN